MQVKRYISGISLCLLMHESIHYFFDVQTVFPEFQCTDASFDVKNINTFKSIIAKYNNTRQYAFTVFLKSATVMDKRVCIKTRPLLDIAKKALFL
ncbi:MAG: hypothetical protein EA394_07230 [Bacteroidia bacterium]|nr:MAG: hypothetical protein EA394_07230 [Bacteroidia bacterium]